MPIVDPRTGEPLIDDTPAGESNAAPSGGQHAEVILDVDRSNIQQLLETSMQVPVLLDCRSPADEASQQLSQVLERLAGEYNGAFLLGRLDIDQEPDIAAQLGVRTAPDVKLISQGGLVDHFQGALPEKQVREWLGRYFPAPEEASESPEEQAAAALEAGDTATARALYQELAGQYPQHAPYQVALARVLVAEDQSQEALALLDNLPPEDRDAAPARGVRASIEFRAEAPTPAQMADLDNRDDSEARYLRALRQLADGHYEGGLEALLVLLKTDRAYGDDAARKTLLRAFDALGADHPLTVTYRRKLFAQLY